jgi:DNA polymerase
MMLVPCKDGRARGLLNYFGASTGRWAGRLIQPQNLARPNPRYEEVDPTAMLEVIEQADIELLELLSDGDAVDFIMSAIRHFFSAPEGKTLVASDFSAIESVVLFCMAGQADMVEAIRRGDRLYSILATQMYGYKVTKKTHPKEDMAGKAGILGLGYQMGAKALVDFAHTIGVEMDFELAQLTVDTYRGNNHCVKNMWNALNRAAVAAVKTGEEKEAYGVAYRTEVINDIPYLLCRLPSGRDLHYPLPELRLEETPWSKAAREDWEEAYKKGLTDEECPEPEYQEGVSYWTTKLGQWMRVRGYGGHWTENVVQAVARDLLADAMLRLDEAGFYLILSVHDEIVAEENESEADLELFEETMDDSAAYAETWPVTCEGWVGREYRK